MTPKVKKFLWKQSQRFWYGILGCLTALLCIFVSPVVARDPGNQGFTASVVSNAMCNLFLKPLSKPLPEAGRGFKSCSPSLVGNGRGVRFERKLHTAFSNISQEQVAKNLYISGRFAEAVKLLQQAYQTSGNQVEKAVILSNLALNLHQLGRIDEASGAIAEAIAILQNTPNSPPVWAQVWDIKGN